MYTTNLNSGCGVGVKAKLPKGRKQDSSDIDKLLKIFKKRVKDTKILKIYHDNIYYTKPSLKNRHTRLIGKYRAQQETINNNM